MQENEKEAPILSTKQFEIPELPKDKPYLGNASVVHELVGNFADQVLAAHGEFLAGKAKGPEAMAKIDDLINKYGDIFMGRDDGYAIAPWQGERMTGTLLGSIGPMKATDDPGVALFKDIALQMVRASISLHKGMDEKEAGEQLKRILDAYRGLILGVNY